MIDDLKPYPAMKDSGVPWLGEVPEHWGVVPLKRLAGLKSGAGFPVAEQGRTDAEVPFFKVSDMNLAGNHRVMRHWNNSVSREMARELGATVFPAGTIVFPKVGGAMLTNKRRITERSCCIDNNMMGCTARNVEHEFLFLLLQNIDLGRLSKPGPVPAISEGETREIRVGLPPSVAEQAGIVRFLGHADRRIRRYIRAKQKLIKLLEEQKQAIIHRAVTRGLDPSVRLKHSGMEWLGDVPEHWEVKRLKSLTRIRYGLGQPPREQEDGLPLLRATNVYRGKIVTKGLLRVDPDDVPMSRNAFVLEGEIIVVRSGAYTADSAIIPGEYGGAVAGYDMVVRVISAHPQFIALALLSSYVRDDQLIIASLRAAQPHLNAEELGTSFILLPPIDEQKRIASVIERETFTAETAIDRARREIALLREFRIRLTADVVTGKLDGRAAATSLPDEADEPDATDETEVLDEGEEASDGDLDGASDEAER
jgi:type I restriction enzyme S subunit